MNISLHDFVKQTLLEITKAVHEAKESAPLSIAPGFVEGEKQLSPQMIKFSVKVTASEEKQENGVGEISVPIITVLKAGVSGKIDSSTEKQYTQSLKFSIPVYFQADKK